MPERSTSAGGVSQSPHNPSPKAHLHPALRWPRQVHRSGHPRLRSSFGEGGGGLPHDFPCELRAGDFGLIFVGLYAECSTCQCYFCGGLAGFVSSSSVLSNEDETTRRKKQRLGGWGGWVGLRALRRWTVTWRTWDSVDSSSRRREYNQHTGRRTDHACIHVAARPPAAHRSAAIGLFSGIGRHGQ